MAKKKKKLQDEKTIHLTHTGWITDGKHEGFQMLDVLMRKFESAKRYSRERIFEGYGRKETVELSKPKFIPNVRYMRDAFLEADANISSQRENLPRYVEQNKHNVQNAKKRMEQLSKEIERHIKKEEFNQVDYKKQMIVYKEYKIKKYEKAIRYFQYHIDNGTVPKPVDGTKQLLKDLNKGRISKQEWRNARSNHLYARGEKSKGGNENIKLSFVKDHLFEMSVLNPLSGKKGDRLHFMVQFPDKFVLPIAAYLETGEAYSIRIKRVKGKYLVHLTAEQDISAKPDFSKGVAGMDINPDNLSVTIIHPNGNFRVSKVFWMHDLNTVRADERDTIVQNTLYEILWWMKTYGIDTLVLEDLNFLQTYKGKAFNRIASNFSYSNVVKILFSIAYKENIALIQVDAYYSSFIGKVKYQQMYGLSVHQAAAFVLARRGMGFKEKIPKNILSVLFAKEAKKGQEVSDLFKHWKKAKEWFDQLILGLRKAKVKMNGLLFSQLLNYQSLSREEDFDFIIKESCVS